MALYLDLCSSHIMKQEEFFLSQGNQKKWLILLQYLLYCSSLKPNPYLQGMPVITELKDAQEKFNIKLIKNSSEHEDKSFEIVHTHTKKKQNKKRKDNGKEWRKPKGLIGHYQINQYAHYRI